MGLPEKPLLNLDQLMDRWKYWGCDYGTLLGYAQDDLIVFSVYLRDIGSHRSVQTDGDTVITTEVQTFQFRNPDAVIRRVFYLDADDARRILEAKPNEQIAVHTLYWSAARINKQATYHASAKYFTAQDLMVTRGECQRFEKQHKASGISSIIGKIGYWITEPSSSNVATRISGAIVVIATAAWAIFKWFEN